MPTACLAVALIAPPSALAAMSKCWSGKMTVPQYLGCLRSIPLKTARRDCTLEVLHDELSSIYTYSGMVRDSSANDARLARGFHFKVHQMHLKEYLHESWAALAEETSAGMFALRIVQMLTKFHDAHTGVYINPIFRTRVNPPVVVEAFEATPGHLAFRVVDGSGSAGKVINQVNGKPALDYFLEVAELMAIDRSRGAMLNRFLSRQFLSGVPPPQDGAFDVAYSDGSSEKLQWSVYLPATACNLGNDYLICGEADVDAGKCDNQTAIMQTCFDYNADFDNLQKLVLKLGKSPLRCSEGGTRLPLPTSHNLGPSGRSPAEKMETMPLPEDPAPAAGTRGVGRDVDSGPPVVVHFHGNGCEVLKVTLPSGGASTVLKISSFSGSDEEILQCAKSAVDLASEVSDGSLVVDVISNGGGSVSAGYVLNDFLYRSMPGSRLRQPWDSCEWYDMPKNEMLDWLVSLSQRDLPDFRGKVTELAARMDQGAEALSEDPHFFGEFDKVQNLRTAAECLRTLAHKFGEDSLNRREPSVRVLRDALYTQCLEVAQPFGGNRGIELMGYQMSNQYPHALLAPSWNFYTSTVTKMRGGNFTSFSDMTFLSSACPAYVAAFPKVYGETVLTSGSWPEAPQTKLKHITYLSDGLCGSTCSVSSTTPFLDGLSTFVTFGGVPGEPMDITSFNGGNVRTYQDGRPNGYSLWKDALDTFIDAWIYFPEDSEAPSRFFLPVPLNVYMVRFAQRAEYPRALGPKALPREWYLIPASYHLNVWSSDNLNTYRDASTRAKETLFDLYSQTAALPPKPRQRQGDNYQATERVLQYEGLYVKDYTDVSVDDCKDLCSASMHCNSFTYSDGTCGLKSLCVTGSEWVVPEGALNAAARTFYRTACRDPSAAVEPQALFSSGTGAAGSTTSLPALAAGAAVVAAVAQLGLAAVLWRRRASRHAQLTLLPLEDAGAAIILEEHSIE